MIWRKRINSRPANLSRQPLLLHVYLVWPINGWIPIDSWSVPERIPTTPFERPNTKSDGSPCISKTPSERSVRSTSWSPNNSAPIWNITSATCAKRIAPNTNRTHCEASCCPSNGIWSLGSIHATFSSHRSSLHAEKWFKRNETPGRNQRRMSRIPKSKHSLASTSFSFDRWTSSRVTPQMVSSWNCWSTMPNTSINVATNQRSIGPCSGVTWRSKRIRKLPKNISNTNDRTIKYELMPFPVNRIAVQSLLCACSPIIGQVNVPMAMRPTISSLERPSINAFGTRPSELDGIDWIFSFSKPCNRRTFTANSPAWVFERER